MHIHLLRVLSALSGALLGTTVMATPQDFIIDPAHTYTTFEVSHLGISTQRGRLGNTTGTVMLDVVQGKGEMNISLDARSLSTGNEFMEKFLKGGSWFAVEQHPVITFNASSFTFVAQKPTRIEGLLTLRGISRPVSLTVAHYACTRLPFGVRLTCGMDAQGVIKRSDFGMDSLLNFVGDEVKLLIQAEAIRQEPAPIELRP
jgi:polyisoprenoid-binding protein YceI